MATYYLDDAGRALVDPLVELWNGFSASLPGVLLGIVVLIVGYIIASALGYALHKVLDKLRVDQQIRKAGVAHSIGFISVASLSGGLLKWFVFGAFFLSQAAQFMQLGVLSDLLVEFARWVPNLILGIIILLGGLVAADYAADHIVRAKRKGAKLASSIVRWAVIVFVGLIALEQVGVRVTLATNTILIIVSGLALGLGLAIGIGFGHALKSEAKGIIKNVKKGL